MTTRDLWAKVYKQH